MRRAVVVLALAALLLSLPARGQDGPRLKNLTGRVTALAMDNLRVAYAVATDDPQCGTKVFIWNVLGTDGAVVSGAATCKARVTEMGVAGNRVGWVAQSDRADELYTAAVPRPVERRLALAGHSGVRGTWLGRLSGDGGVLVFNLWSTDAARRITSGALRRIYPKDLHTIKEGVGTLFVRAADANRLAVLRAGGNVVLYARDGRLIRSIAAPGTTELALQGRDLVALAGTQVAVYDTLTGSRVHTWTLLGVPNGVDAHFGVAAYALGGDVHALQLATGKDVVVAQAVGPVRDLELEDAGLVFAYEVDGTGNLGYLTSAQIAARFTAT